MNLRSLGAVAVALLVGCGEGSLSVEASDEEVGSAMTWEAFLEQTYQEPLTGVYVVDGDTPVEDVKQLREFYTQHVQSGGLAVQTTRSGADAKWDSQQKRQLRYCVSKGFGARYDAAVQAMEAATGAWEAVADVDFIHAADQDENCTSRNGQVVFDVNPVNAGGWYAARAFFPGQGRSTRNVLIDGSAFQPFASPSLTGILRHELGHTLGFRHEHTRPEAGVCFEDRAWRALTDYDARSVMHYPQCNGRGGTRMELSILDAMGAAALYGAPGQVTVPPTASDARSESLAGTVAKGQAKLFGPYDVAAGSLVEVVMTGSGDPDLYVSFGAAPTSNAYACRPYLSGADEACRLDVPAGAAGQLYVAVAGYTEASFQVDVRYHAP